MTTRADFLGGIRREMAKTRGLFEARTAARPSDAGEAFEVVKRQMAERWPQALTRFQEEFERIAGVFHRVRRLDGVPGVIRRIADEREARRILSWHPGALGLDLRESLGRQGLSVTLAPDDDPDAEARRLHRDEAARAEIGVTGVDWALAETGTLVLVSGRGRPRSTSLLPATHVAVFDRGRLLESLEQVGAMLEALHADPSRSMSGAVINFITGPSRTADIELTLTRGVHGPKEVHAIFVEAP
ncbi:MAG TPA: lactate utilization protein [Candidatus Bathyarchaeia archaeon]|nr:lactate utilization protein [Candidatus Bathyarchaeia archaeon]